MVSRNQLIIVTAIVFLGLMGPISFFFQPGTGEAAPLDAPELPSAPTGYLTPMSTLSGTSPAVVEFKEPRLSASAFSDFANLASIRETVLAIPGVKNASITKEENPGEEGLYLISFNVELNHGSDGMQAMYLISRRVESITFSEFSQLATIILPPTITLTSISGGEEELSTANAAVTALVFPYAKVAEEYEFQISTKESGAVKQVIALMRSSPPDYPITTEDFNATVTVDSVNGYGLEASVPSGIDVNSTELSDALNAQAFYSPPSANGSTGFLQIMSESRVNQSLVPGTVITEFSLADVIPPVSVGGYSTSEFAILSRRKMPATAEPGDSVDSIITLNILFGEVDSVNVVAKSLQ